MKHVDSFLLFFVSFPPLSTNLQNKAKNSEMNILQTSSPYLVHMVYEWPIMGFEIEYIEQSSQVNIRQLIIKKLWPTFVIPPPSIRKLTHVICNKK